MQLAADAGSSGDQAYAQPQQQRGGPQQQASLPAGDNSMMGHERRTSSTSAGGGFVLPAHHEDAIWNAPNTGYALQTFLLLQVLGSGASVGQRPCM